VEIFIFYKLFSIIASRVKFPPTIRWGKLNKYSTLQLKLNKMHNFWSYTFVLPHDLLQHFPPFQPLLFVLPFPVAVAMFDLISSKLSSVSTENTSVSFPASLSVSRLSSLVPPQLASLSLPHLHLVCCVPLLDFVFYF